MAAESWTASFDFMEAGRRLRRFSIIERSLFELVGQWVQPERDVAAKLQFGEQCYRHVRHAEMLEGLLPTPSGQYPLAYADPTQLFPLADAETAADSDSRLRALYRGILPPLHAEYAAHLDRTNPITDAPTMRVLRLVLGDLETDLAAGAALMRAA